MIRAGSCYDGREDGRRTAPQLSVPQPQADRRTSRSRDGAAHLSPLRRALGSVRLLQQELDAGGIRSKSWISTADRRWGGKPLAGGALYTMLRVTGSIAARSYTRTSIIR